jgi:hypothetical protein
MIATDFHLIPLAQLCKHESTVLARLDLLTNRYAESLLEEPEVRYPFLYYALFTHWPELLGELSDEERFYNRYYWFLRMSKQQQSKFGYDASLEQQADQLVEYAEISLDSELIVDLQKRVTHEIATNEWEIAVAFSHFSINKVLTQFNLELDENGDQFLHVAGVAISGLLQETLKENVPLALAMATEKARSEFIVAPVLSEIRRQLANTISLFSGIELDVDPAAGLRGTCDFLLCQSPHQLVLRAPLVAIVEVKKEDVNAGIGQCIAEMVAARIFNQQHGTNIPVIYGVVTTGTNWRFLRLVDATVYIDATEYYIKEVERIVGIIVSMFKCSGVTV